MNQAQSSTAALWSRHRVATTTLSLLLFVPLGTLAQETVGDDGGTQPTIQDAVDACVLAGGECEVHVQADPDPYMEHLVIPATMTAGTITITGGWYSNFTMRDPGSSMTTIDGGNTGRVVDVRVGGGTVTLDGFTIEHGSSNSGAGIHVGPTGASDATVELMNLEVRNNQAESDGYTYGAGVWGELDGTEHLEISLCQIVGNTATVTSGTGAAAGAGVLIAASGDATLLAEHSWVEDNTAHSDTARKDGAGHFFSLGGNASGEIVNLRTTGNAASGSEPQVNGSGGNFYLTDNAQLVVRRSAWAGNTDSTGDTSEQLRLSCYDNSSLLLTDSITGLGGQNGILGTAATTAELQLVNLTVVDNTLTGIQLVEYDSSTVTLYNSIAYGNGTDADLDAGVDTGGSCLIGVDPLFMDPPNLNYRLGLGSPALDVGVNNPPGGLGPTDFDGLPRLENLTVDLGAYEGAGMLFYDGFEGGGTGEWSDTLP